MHKVEGKDRYQMLQMKRNLLQATKDYVKPLLKKMLSPKLHFHSLEHTEDVVNASRLIAKTERLSNIEEEVLLISAWFHDTGYIQQYSDHEEVGQQYAKAFLSRNAAHKFKIRSVLECIEATKYGVVPSTVIEEIICDADTYHLSTLDYFETLAKLRREWEFVFKMVYDDNEWWELNLKFLLNHRYYTRYGKEVMEKGKQANIQKIVAVIN